MAFEDPQSGLWGYRSGQHIAIAASYHIAGDFNQYGIAAVAADEGWQYIDTNGNVVLIPFVYDNAPDVFVENLARYVESDKIGFCDERGQRLIAARYDFARPFSQGLAAVCTGCTRQYDGEHYSYVGGRWGYIDYLVDEVIPLRFEAAESFAAGRARVYLDHTWIALALPDTLPQWQTLQGFLPKLVMSHPLLDAAPFETAYGQFYLDVGEEA